VVVFRGAARPGGRRDLCRGAVRSAALRGGPVGRRTQARDRRSASGWPAVSRWSAASPLW